MMDVRYQASASDGMAAPPYARSSSLVVDLNVQPPYTARYAGWRSVGGTRTEQRGTMRLDPYWVLRIARLVEETRLEPLPDRPRNVDGAHSTIRLTFAFADGRRQEGRPVNVGAWAALIRAVVAQADSSAPAPR